MLHIWISIYSSDIPLYHSAFWASHAAFADHRYARSKDDLFTQREGIACSGKAWSVTHQQGALVKLDVTQLCNVTPTSQLI